MRTHTCHVGIGAFSTCVHFASPWRRHRHKMEADLMYGLRQPPRPLDGADSESDTEEEDPPMCPAGLFEHAEAFFTT